MSLRAKYEITMASGSDYISDWMPCADIRPSDEAEVLREALLEDVGRVIRAGGLFVFPRQGRQVAVGVAQIEFLEVVIDAAP